MKNEPAGLLRETYHIVSAMRRAGNYGVIARWKDSIAHWAERNPDNADAAAVLSWLPFWQIRAFRTAEELAPMWPALAIATGFTNRWPAVLKSARRLEHELDFYGLPRLPEPWRTYFICERIHFWKRASIEEISIEMQKSLRR
jgi:hypothetical protein